MSNTIRMTGLATGLDTDNMVKQLMQPYQTRLDSLKQNRQITQWQQDIFRDIIGSINTFKSTYFDVLKQDTYILSSKNLSPLQSTTTDTTNSVVLSPGATAISGDYTINVANIARKAIQTSTTSINVKQVSGSLTFPVVIDSTNNKLTVDGKQLTLENDTYSSLSGLASKINSKLASTDDGTDLSGTVKAVVSGDGKSIVMKHLTETTDSNSSLTVTTADGKNFNVTLGTGKYTMDELASAINNKLAAAKASDGSKIPTGFTASVSSDGMSIVYTGGGTDNRNYHIDSKAVVDSSGIGAGSTSVSNPSVSGDTLSYDRRIIQNVNDTLILNINGTRTTISLTSKDYTSDSNAYASIAQDINDQLAGVNVPGTTDGSKMYTDANNYKLKAYVDADGNLNFKSVTDFQVSMSGDAASTLGMPSTFTVNQTTSDYMSTLVSGQVKFTINGQTFHYDFSTDTTDDTNKDDIITGAKSMTIKEIMDDISSKANVDITYSELTRKFSISSKDTGYDQTIDAADESGGFLTTLLGVGTISGIRGEDAEVTITNPREETNTLHYSKNTFILDDVNYTLNKEGTGPITFSVTSNTDKAVDKVKDFIEKYNTLIDQISTKVNESRPKTSQYDGYYLPLTDDQKKSMSADQIKTWEDMAKQGLVKNDSNLNDMLYSLRKALYDSVEDAGISLTQIGLSTSSDYTQGGKIVINDEQKLRDALTNNPDKVLDLFTKTSSTPYSPDHADNDKRYNEEGIFQRINDILQDNVRTIRDSSGNKGTLLQKAGIVGDYSEFNNTFYSELEEQDKQITDFTSKMSDIEDRYYNQFTQLETAMQQLNSQSSWLQQQLGTSGS